MIRQILACDEGRKLPNSFEGTVFYSQQDTQAFWARRDIVNTAWSNRDAVGFLHNQVGQQYTISRVATFRSLRILCEYTHFGLADSWGPILSAGDIPFLRRLCTHKTFHDVSHESNGTVGQLSSPVSSRSIPSLLALPTHAPFLPFNTYMSVRCGIPWKPRVTDGANPTRYTRCGAGIRGIHVGPIYGISL